MKGPRTGFSNATDSVLNNFCYGEFLTYYTVENKSRKTCKYQPGDFDDNLIGINHIERTYLPPTAQPNCYPHPFPENIIDASGETKQFWKVRQILWYHVRNKL